jgi:hypothetical protein
MARHGEDVFITLAVLLPEVPGLNNVRWTLFKRTAQGWELQQQAQKEDLQSGDTYLGLFSDGRLLMRTNPPKTRGARSGPARPHLLQFLAAQPRARPTPTFPVWPGEPAFTDHPYGGLSVDGPNRELVLFGNVGYQDQYWAFLDRSGKWINRGAIHYPIRIAYHTIALAGGACHVMGIGDWDEPVAAWHQFKVERNPIFKRWDYVFRQLFYMEASSIATTQFCPPLEIDSVESTAGRIFNMDVWVDREGAVHLLYVKKTVDHESTPTLELRNRFFPGVPSIVSLEECVIRNGKFVSRQTLALGNGETDKGYPVWARLHGTEDGRLFVFYSVSHNLGFRLMEILPGARHSRPVEVPLKMPFFHFQTAGQRSGSAPSHILDVLGSFQGKPGAGYARIRLGTLKELTGPDRVVGFPRTTSPIRACG